MSDFSGLFSVRDGTSEDTNFILATFLRGLYYGDSWFSNIPKDIFMANYKTIASALVNSANTTIVVACLPDAPEVILGYSIVSTDFQTVHFTYVKKPWRRRGVARALLPKHPIAATHLTALGKELLSKLPGCIFNPFAINN